MGRVGFGFVLLLFSLKGETDSDTNFKKITQKNNPPTNQQTYGGLDSLVALSLPLYMVTSVSINSFLHKTEKLKR